MKKILLTIIIITTLLHPLLSAPPQSITINDTPITFITLNNEPYIPYQEIFTLNMDPNWFSSTGRENYGGVIYLRLKDVCNQIGLISANKTNSQLKIVVNLSKFIFSVWTNDLIFKDKKITIYIYHSTAGLVYQTALPPGKTEAMFFPPGVYTFKTDSFTSQKEVTEYNGLTGLYYNTTKNSGSFYWEKTVTGRGGEIMEVLLNDDSMRWLRVETK